jgi:ADP-heptose:LPS heptosyltransferase
MIVKPILNKQVPYPMELFLSTKDKIFARDFLLKNKIKKFAIIHAGARSKGSKEWTDEKFATVADYLIEKKGLKIIFGGAEKDRAKNESIISKMKNKSNAINLAGKTSLLEYAALISKTNLVVSVSTAALHIACAFKVKLLSLYSENLKIWYPWENPNSRTIYKENLSEITSEEAISKINELLPN